MLLLLNSNSNDTPSSRKMFENCSHKSLLICRDAHTCSSCHFLLNTLKGTLYHGNFIGGHFTVYYSTLSGTN